MTRFTKNAARLTVALALSLISAGTVSADYGRGPIRPIGQRVDVDIRSLEATYTPRGFAPGVQVSYRVSAEDVRRGQSFELQLRVVDRGRTVQTIVVPLNRGVARGRDEINFRGTVTIPAGRGFSQHAGHMRVIASVVQCGTGRVLETEDTSIRFIGHDGHGRGPGHRGSTWGR